MLLFLVGGIGDVFGGVVARRIGGYSSVFWLYFFGLIFASFYVPFAVGDLQKLTLGTGLLLSVLAVIGVIPAITLFEGIRVGTASLVGTIGSAFAAIAVILSIIFLGDKINFSQTFSIIVIFVGLVLSSIDLKTLKAKQLFTDKGVPYGLISMVLWGIYFTFIRIPAREIGWLWPAYFSWCAFPLVYVFMRIKKVKLEMLKGTKLFTNTILNALFSAAAIFAFNFAVAKGQTAIVAPISGLYPVLFAVLGYFVFKDRLKKQRILGIAVTLVGIVLLAVISPS